MALLTRYLWQVSAAPHAAVLPILGQRFADAYVSNAGLITILSLGVFYASGFYTHGRSYRGRYKAIVVAQAVSLVYLLTAALNFMLPQLDFPAAQRGSAGVGVDAVFCRRRARLVACMAFLAKAGKRARQENPPLPLPCRFRPSRAS